MTGLRHTDVVTVVVVVVVAVADVTGKQTVVGLTGPAASPGDDMGEAGSSLGGV